ncbi:MAG: hypothetical protein PUB76_07455 [Oscillospiraceae bacterium]|nr:hypothetical protein [Oscillospiraceae bacterium]
MKKKILYIVSSLIITATAVFVIFNKCCRKRLKAGKKSKEKFDKYYGEYYYEDMEG